MVLRVLGARSEHLLNAALSSSLKVSRVDELLLRTLQPQLLNNALQHIFRGSLSRFVLQQTALSLGMLLFWALAAAVGRAATLRRLVAMFSLDTEEDDLANIRWRIAPIFVLYLLRALWTAIALLVAIGSLAYGAVMFQDEHAFRAAAALSFGVGVASCIGIFLNWYFALAPLFCIRNGAGVMQSIEQAVDFSALHPGRLTWYGIFFGAARLLWAGIMLMMFLSPLRLAGSIAVGWVLVLMGMVALVYFAGADALYLARLGAYVSLAEDDAHPPEEPARIEPPPDLVPLVGLA